ncbi:MAG: Fe(2+) transporter permease subunit FeoB, partial [Alphaproteobacteria bacterium]|nr:Fe(2+) transporter permease subunit FeoB [Alphaproteobacteria bacterium]
SLDEKLARDYVAAGEAELVVNIIDAANLERNLYLTTQLREMGTPVVVALNMLDVARERGIRIDPEALAARLGCPVVSLVASRGEGIDRLKDEIARTAAAPARAIPEPVHYRGEVEEAIAALEQALDAAAPGLPYSHRWVAVQLLEGDPDLAARVGPEIAGKAREAAAAIEEAGDEDIDILLADGRYAFIHALTGDVVKRAGRLPRTLSDRIDRVVLHRALGIPIFFALMYLMFMWTINVGSAFIDFFDIFAGTLAVDGTAALLGSLGSPDWLTVVLADGIGGGIQTVATFIPIIAFLYLFLSVLEDSGYMARAAFVMDRFMRSAGLPGKAFVPLIVGFGCNVPAIMATRTLENDADRKTAIMMSPFMSCGARLPVYALFAAAFFPTNGQNLVFALYLIGILVAVITGYVLRATILSGSTSPLVMELPPYHLPTARNVLLRTWDRLKAFIFRAGRVIVPMVMVLSVLNAVGTDGSFGNEDSEDSVLAAVGKAIVPVFEPMGVEEDNWPATVGIFTGMFAKEAVVGTLDALYGALGAEDGAAAAEEPGAYDPLAGIIAAFATIPENLAGLAGTAGDPLGLSVGDLSDSAVAAGELEVSTGTFGAMVERFDGQVAAFAYLLFILLYFPCVAALGAVYRELDGKWTAFTAAWTTGMAYMVAVGFYQAANITRTPETSIVWLVALALAFAAAVAGLRYAGRDGRIVPQPAE